MRSKLEQRLKGLRLEFDRGQEMLSSLETKQVSLRTTLLRISGAIQVLEEELSKNDNGSSEQVSRTESGQPEAVSLP